MPVDIANKLNAEMVRIMALPDVKERALKGGNEIVANSQEQFIKDMNQEIEFWTRVIKQKNIKEE
jgi:tripartite-type tricarboxylate transporter receptor subunit TctC